MIKTNQTKQLGFSGEQAVADFLKNKNFTILTQNYSTKLGEVDLIAEKDELVVFVEVKTRKRAYFPISNVVTFKKQQKIIKAAKFFILKNNIIDKACRFDVATVILGNDEYNIEYIENAFYGR